MHIYIVKQYVIDLFREEYFEGFLKLLFYFYIVY